MTPPIAYSISQQSNLNYLPFVYILPEEVIVKYPTLHSLPRGLGEVARSEKLMNLIDSDAFLNEIMSAVASLVFPYFGFSGWIENYTGYFPVWRLAYALPIWVDMLEKETGWGLQKLFLVPSSDTINFLPSESVKGLMERMVKRAIAENEWQPMLDVIREMPCDEDFEPWATNVRIDFMRKWYHTRSKKVQTVSLEACLEDDEHAIYEIADDTNDIADDIAVEDFCRRFRSRLSEKDMAILELRVEGFTYEEIAKELGYKNYSGVIKRMQAITKAFIQYEEKRR